MERRSCVSIGLCLNCSNINGLTSPQTSEPALLSWHTWLPRRRARARRRLRAPAAGRVSRCRDHTPRGGAPPACSCTSVHSPGIIGLNSINCLNRERAMVRWPVRRAAHLSELRARGGRSAGLRVVRRHHLERPPGSVPWPAQQLERRARRTAHARADGAARLIAPGLPRYAVRTQRPRLVRVPRTYSTWGPGGKPPCASRTYSTREAGTRSPYVPYEGAGAHVSASHRTG